MLLLLLLLMIWLLVADNLGIDTPVVGESLVAVSVIVSLPTSVVVPLVTVVVVLHVVAAPRVVVAVGAHFVSAPIYPELDMICQQVTI